MIGDAVGSETYNWYQRMGWGRMFSTGHPQPYPDEPYGLDNGAWAASLKGKSFPEKRFLHRMSIAKERAEKCGTHPYMCVTPDIVRGGTDSLKFSLDWLPRLTELGYGNWSWYLAVQNGMDFDEVARILPYFAGLFLGGTWDLMFVARRWSGVARRAGVPFHYGGCGTKQKLAHAFELKADSIDSVGPRRCRQNMRTFVRWWQFLTPLHFPELQE